MTANLLSVIEQQQKALKHAIKWLNICDKPRECMPLHAALAAGQQALEQTRGDVSYMVNRFLGWSLPRDFNPDCHIAFDRDAASYNQHSWPIGTNLLTADQAKAMFEYCLQGATHPKATEPAPSTDKTKEYSMRDWFNDLDNPHANR